MSKSLIFSMNKQLTPKERLTILQKQPGKQSHLISIRGIVLNLNLSSRGIELNLNLTVFSLFMQSLVITIMKKRTYSEAINIVANTTSIRNRCQSVLVIIQKSSRFWSDIFLKDEIIFLQLDCFKLCLKEVWAISLPGWEDTVIFWTANTYFDKVAK